MYSEVTNFCLLLFLEAGKLTIKCSLHARNVIPLLFNLIPTLMMLLYVLWKCQAWREANIHCHNYFNEREWRRCFSAICQQKAVISHARLYSPINCSSVLNTEFSITPSRSTAFIIFPGPLWSLQIITPKMLINFELSHIQTGNFQHVICSVVPPQRYTCRGDKWAAGARVPLLNVKIP